MSEGASTITTTGPLGIRRGEYFAYFDRGERKMHRVTEAGPDRSTLTARPVVFWETPRRFFEDYIKWPIRDFDRWLTAKVRGPWTCLVVGHRPSRRQYADGSPMFSMRYRICTRCHQMPPMKAL